MQLHEIERALRYMDPIVIRFEDTQALEIVPRPHLTDISWCDRNRPVKVLGDLADYGESATDILEQLED